VPKDLVLNLLLCSAASETWSEHVPELDYIVNHMYLGAKVRIYIHLYVLKEG